jgi:hypothetical protein
VSFGHALLPPLTADNHMYHRVLDWFKTEFPGVEHTLDLSGALPAVSKCADSLAQDIGSPDM